MKKLLFFICSALMFVSCSKMRSNPNLVIFYADDLGWGDLSVNNNDPFYFRHTPNIDKIFTSGITLDNYMTHCVCSPSRAGLLTGKHYANVHSGPRTGGTLPNNIPNIAKDFQAAGYKTGAFGKWHNGMPNFPAEGNGQVVNFDSVKVWNELYRYWTSDLTNGIFDNTKGYEWGEGVNAYGFDRWVGYHSGGGDLFSRFINWHHDIDWWHDRSYVPDEKGYTTDLITKHASNFIDENKNEPFFCYIPQQAVHGPVQIKLSDLKELCSHYPGEWDYVKEIVSPTTGRKIEDVEEIRCESGAEFDANKIDRNQEHFLQLVYATYLYSLDKSVGAVIQKVREIGQQDNTIFVFACDNGATPRGCNLPFRGSKHTLWEGGVHVPAAIWWPKTFDANTAPYSPDDNKYNGFIGYLDMYPTLLAMAGQQCNGSELDGANNWSYLKTRKNGRPGLENAYYWMWMDHGTVRTDRWKLVYSEAAGRAELYDLKNDISESTNVSENNPEITETMIGMYKKWVEDNNYALSYMIVPENNISHPNPEPEGDLLEINAIQTSRNLKDKQTEIFIRCTMAELLDESNSNHIEAGDRLEYDIYICEDSELSNGIAVSATVGSAPFFKATNGINQHGEAVRTMDLKKGEWTRQIVGIGNLCPSGVGTPYISLQSQASGKYHFYLDNIVVRRKDGGIRKVLWKSAKNSTKATILHSRKNYKSIASALSAQKFPLDNLTIKTIKYGEE